MDRELVLEIDLHATCELAHAIPREALAVLRLFDGRRSLQDVVDDSPLPLETTLEVMRHLGNLGLLRLAPRGRPDNKLPGPEVRRWLGRLVSQPLWPAEEEAGEGLDDDMAESLVADTSDLDGSPPGDLAAVPVLLERSLEKLLEERLADVPDILDDGPYPWSHLEPPTSEMLNP